MLLYGSQCSNEHFQTMKMEFCDVLLKIYIQVMGYGLIYCWFWSFHEICRHK